jgi:purine-binding chemotaxis protein CheW
LTRTAHQQSRPAFVSSHEGQKQSGVFTVRAAGELFGLPVEAVHTIFRISKITPIPLGPAIVVGLVNLRGKVVTAVSMRRRLEMKDIELYEGALAIGIEHHAESYALLVDEVGDVVNISESERIAAPANMSSFRLNLTAGVYRLDAGFISVLDMDALLDFNHASSSSRHELIGVSA